MAGLNNNNDDMISGINVTPLVDIVLVLLIIFMVTAKLMMSPSVNVDLPKVTKSDTTQESPLNVTLTKDEQILLNGKTTNWDALPSLVSTLLKTNANVHAIISADKDVKHGSFMKLLDVVQMAGVTHFSINVDVASKD